MEEILGHDLVSIAPVLMPVYILLDDLTVDDIYCEVVVICEGS